MTSDNNKNTDHEEASPGLFSLLQSVIAAIFGVQNDKNRQKDFQKGDATQFIALGIGAVIFILIVMIIIVKSVISNTNI